jgi:hypothetical protein
MYKGSSSYVEKVEDQVPQCSVRGEAEGNRAWKRAAMEVFSVER